MGLFVFVSIYITLKVKLHLIRFWLIRGYGCLFVLYLLALCALYLRTSRLTAGECNVSLGLNLFLYIG